MDYKPLHELRSASNLLLNEPAFTTETGRRSFRYSPVTTCKGLPDYNRTEYSLYILKGTQTHLFRLSYYS